MSEDPETVTPEQVRQGLLEAIAAQTRRAPNATTLLRLAEAYAWVMEPAQAHGGKSEG